MRGFRPASVLALASVLVASWPIQQRALAAVTPLLGPESVGDQVVFYYDARDTFTTFVNVQNTGASDLNVQLLIYGPGIRPGLRRVRIRSTDRHDRKRRRTDCH